MAVSFVQSLILPRLKVASIIHQHPYVDVCTYSVPRVNMMPGKPWPFFFGWTPHLDQFSRMVIFCWPVAVFGRMQPVFFEQIVDKNPLAPRMAVFFRSNSRIWPYLPVWP